MNDIEIIINIPVLNDAYNQCIEINKKICAMHGDLIKYVSLDSIFPHITLKMGKIKMKNLKHVICLLKEYFKNVSVMTLNTNNIILKKPNNKYYFAEIYDEKLMTISKDLDQLLKTFMEDSEHIFSKNNLHHVTLGRKNEDDIKICSIVSMNIGKIFADRIYVSVKGKYGVCINILESIELVK